MQNSIWPDGDQTQELLNRVEKGDQSAVNTVLEKHRESLRQMIGMRLDRKITQRVDVSDIIQEVMFEASRRMLDYINHPVMPFHLWIRHIAKDRIIDAHRRHRVSAKRSIDREYRLVSQGQSDQSSMDLAGQLCDPELTPAAAATQREIAAHMQSVIDLLPDRDREIILMRHYEQLSNQEIAQSFGITEPAASMRYLRAIKRLREKLNLTLSQDASSPPSEE